MVMSSWFMIRPTIEMFGTLRRAVSCEFVGLSAHDAIPMVATRNITIKTVGRRTVKNGTMSNLDITNFLSE